MKHVSPAAPAALVVAGSSATLAGIYLLAGLAVALIVGGLASTAVGLLVDI